MNVQAIATKWAAIKPEMIAQEASKKHIQSVLEDMQRQIGFLCRELDKAHDATRLAERVAKLNPDAGEIGAGMLASLVEEARRCAEEPGRLVRAPYSTIFTTCSCQAKEKDDCSCQKLSEQSAPIANEQRPHQERLGRWLQDFADLDRQVKADALSAQQPTASFLRSDRAIHSDQTAETEPAQPQVAHAEPDPNP